MAGKHRLRNRQVRHAAPHRALEVVDAHIRTTHVLTTDALAVIPSQRPRTS